MATRQSKAERAALEAQMKATERRMLIGAFVAICVLVLAGVAVAVVFNRRHAEEARSPHVQWDSQWPPLPATQRRIGSPEDIQHSYAFAARREDVVSYLPCYCGCARQGHTSLRSCFIKSRTADGQPVWDAMGFT